MRGTVPHDRPAAHSVCARITVDPRQRIRHSLRLDSPGTFPGPLPLRSVSKRTKNRRSPMGVTLAHRYGRATARVAALLILLAVPRPALAVGGIGDLFVSSDAANNITAYNGISGNALGVFTNSVL